jgi:hypothetical protein
VRVRVRVRFLLAAAVATVYFVPVFATPADDRKQQTTIVTEMTPALVEEAITRGERGDYKLDGTDVLSTGLFGYTMSTAGVFTTPFSRVVRAAQAAKREYRPFTSADVSATLLAPEVVFTLFSEVVSDSPPQVHNPVHAVIKPPKSERLEDVCQPLRKERGATPRTFRNSLGAVLTGQDLVVAFPLGVLDEQHVVVIVWDDGKRTTHPLRLKHVR